jgi:hypothetical protein
MKNLSQSVCRLLSLALVLPGFACRQKMDRVVVNTTPTPPATATPQPGVPAVQSLVIVPAHRPDGLQSRALLIEEVEFKKRPQTGAPVTIIPLGVNLAAAQSRITRVKEVADPCSEALPKRWQIEIAPLTQDEYVKGPSANPSEADGRFYPFQVAVFYPAVAQARALDRGLLDLATLPQGARLENVDLAIDLNGDQQPDLALLEYCCDKPQLSRKDCDLTCEKIYLRVDGKWNEIDYNTPC